MRIWIQGAKGMHRTAPKANTTVKDAMVFNGVVMGHTASGRPFIVAARHLDRLTVKAA